MMQQHHHPESEAEAMIGAATANRVAQARNYCRDRECTQNWRTYKMKCRTDSCKQNVFAATQNAIKVGKFDSSGKSNTYKHHTHTHTHRRKVAMFIADRSVGYVATGLLQ